ISVSQATSAPELHFTAMVHNAVEIPTGPPSRSKERYLIEVARIVPNKGQHLAIEVARRTGRKLILGGKVERTGEGESYFEEEIDPARCAEVARERFSPARMADDYLRVYQSGLAIEPLTAAVTVDLRSARVIEPRLPSG